MSSVVMFSDFGPDGLYRAQVEGTIYGVSPALKFIELISNAPRFDPYLSGFLLAACAKHFPPDTVFIGVVDPGVGTSQREPVVIRVGEQKFVGPDNGLFDVLANQYSGGAVKQTILWQPKELSASFHGRDLFAPVAARLASGEPISANWLSSPVPLHTRHREMDTARIIYFDSFGNALTGIRASTLKGHEVIACKGHRVKSARTFGDVPEHQLFWYANSLGLVELAVNQGSARDQLALALGDEICIEE